MAAIDWAKIILDYLKGNKWLVIWALGAVLGIGGNIFQAVGQPAPKVTTKPATQCVPCSFNSHIKEYH